MNQELVYRMRTCAAALNTFNAHTEPLVLPLRDAIDLLVEASNLLDAPEPLGEPMDLIASVHTKPTPKPTIAQWGGDLFAGPRPCPACGSVDARSVHRNGRRLQITCPKCAHQWEYGT